MVTTKELLKFELSKPSSIPTHILNDSIASCVLKDFFSFKYVKASVILTFLDCIISLNPCINPC